MKATRAETYFAICEVLSKRSSCLRGQVGAIIVKDNRIISTGYNDKVRGLNDCHLHNCNVEEKCIDAVHAEVNAIINAARSGAITLGAELWCTTCPCLKCAQVIANSGIVKVHYLKDYSDNSGKILLKRVGIEIEYKAYRNDPKSV